MGYNYKDRDKQVRLWEIHDLKKVVLGSKCLSSIECSVLMIVCHHSNRERVI